MTVVRSLITNYQLGDLPRDKVSNTVYHEVDDGGINPAVDYQSHAAEVLAAFVGGVDDPAFRLYQHRFVEVRCYDMADAKPRAEKAFATTAAPSSVQTLFPTELAVVLSFYCTRNIAGLRSHIFLGPLPTAFWAAGQDNTRPNSDLVTNVLALGNALFNIGGENVKHVLRHPAATKSGHAAGSTDVVSDYNVADSWGIVHSRNLRLTQRTRLHP